MLAVLFLGILAALVTLGVAGAIAVWLALHHPTIGFQDKYGFHRGVETAPFLLPQAAPTVPSSVPPQISHKRKDKAKMIGLLGFIWTPSSRRHPMR